MRTGDPAKAWKVMAYTALQHERLKEASGQSRAGRKLEKPVFAFSLAWHPEQEPSQEHMLETARKAIETLGLSEHEHVIVSHKDEPQKHVHVIVNRVHPLTGLAGDVRNSKRKLSDFAREYEETDGKIYCAQRVENRKMRRQGKATHYADPVIVEAWRTSGSGREFAAALQARGYALAQGRKRLVIVDPHGKSHNPARLLNVRARDIQERLRDLDLSRLPVAGMGTGRDSRPKDAERESESREAFEHLASIEIYALRKKHRQEASDLTSQQRLRLDSAKERLAKFYELRKRKREIEGLHEKIRQARWWGHLIGATRRNREAHRDQVQGYKSAHARYREKILHIEEQDREALARLHSRQAAETISLETRIENLRHARHYEGTIEQNAEKDRLRSGLRAAFSAAHGLDAKENEENSGDRRLRPHSKAYPHIKSNDRSR
jgi:hypothetical protein